MIAKAKNFFAWVWLVARVGMAKAEDWLYKEMR